MRKILCTLGCLILFFKINGQPIWALKEHYDENLESHYTTGAYDFTNPAIFNGTILNWGEMLHSYLVMYKTTKDKAYLNKFIKHVYRLQELRDINSSHLAIGRKMWHITDANGDFEHEFEFLYGGLLLRSMAEYVKIVKTDPNLYNSNLLVGLIPSTFNLKNSSRLCLGVAVCIISHQLCLS